MSLKCAYRYRHYQYKTLENIVTMKVTMVNWGKPLSIIRGAAPTGLTVGQLKDGVVDGFWDVERFFGGGPGGGINGKSIFMRSNISAYVDDGL